MLEKKLFSHMPTSFKNNLRFEINLYFKITLKFIFLFLTEIPAQNLVPNFSFEDLNKHPKKGHTSGVALIKDWTGANYGPGDYYFADNPDKSSSIPTNIFGTEAPHSGKAYSGICIEKDFIEYLQVDLVKPLIKDKTYKITLFISKCEKRKSFIKEFGILFLPKRKEYFLGGGISLKPQIEFINESGYKNEIGWTELSEEYLAKGFENTIVIGYFIYNKPEGFNGKAHYYIDDVSITCMDSLIEKTTMPENKDTLFSSSFDEYNKLILKNIAFDTDESILKPSSYKELLLLFNFLKINSNLTIEISGHTDNIGAESHNLILSENRAKVVADFLIERGIPKNRVLYKGKGSSIPVADNESEIGRTLNRRVEIEILNPNKN